MYTIQHIASELSASVCAESLKTVWKARININNCLKIPDVL